MMILLTKIIKRKFNKILSQIQRIYNFDLVLIILQQNINNKIKINKKKTGISILTKNPTTLKNTKMRTIFSNNLLLSKQNSKNRKIIIAISERVLNHLKHNKIIIIYPKIRKKLIPINNNLKTLKNKMGITIFSV